MALRLHDFSQYYHVERLDLSDVGVVVVAQCIQFQRASRVLVLWDMRDEGDEGLALAWAVFVACHD